MDSICISLRGTELSNIKSKGTHSLFTACHEVVCPNLLGMVDIPNVTTVRPLLCFCCKLEVPIYPITFLKQNKLVVGKTYSTSYILSIRTQEHRCWTSKTDVPCGDTLLCAL